MSGSQFLQQAKPYLWAFYIQFTFAIMSILAKYSLAQGLNQHVLVAYRMGVATILITPFAIVLERNTRPKMTLQIFCKIMLLSIFEPVITQNLFYTGMKYTTATFTSALSNILPAIIFIMACLFRLEKVKVESVHSHAKIWGTIFAVGGAMTMTFFKGPIVEFPWKNIKILQDQLKSFTYKEDDIKGSLMIIGSCFSWSCFFIFQSFVLNSYPAAMSLAALVSMISSVEGAILAFAIERRDTAVWLLQFDAKLLTVIYGGFESCTAYFIIAWLMKKRGPVFISAFNPSSTIITTILGSLFLAETLYIGGIVGAVVIVIGLYMVLWGQSNDQP